MKVKSLKKFQTPSFENTKNVFNKAMKNYLQVPPTVATSFQVRLF